MEIKKRGKIFAIGDIHGCYDKLRSLIERLPYDPQRDTIVFLGDYIDRGPHSKEVITYLCQLKRQVKKCIMLIGNHEYLMLEYHRTGDPALLPFLRHLGIDSTLQSYGANSPQSLQEMHFLPEEHRQLLHSLLPYWETEDYIFVHAGVAPEIPLEQQDLSSLCETRSTFLLEEHDYGKLVIFGHTPFDMPFVTPTRIGIDTGAVYGNLLTALELPGLLFHHAS
jgi:serine/threonine protein phosphatase 1